MHIPHKHELYSMLELITPYEYSLYTPYEAEELTLYRTLPPMTFHCWNYYLRLRKCHAKTTEVISIVGIFSRCKVFRCKGVLCDQGWSHMLYRSGSKILSTKSFPLHLAL